MKRIQMVSIFVFMAIYMVAQTTNIQVHVNNSNGDGSKDYTINGISKSKDIGGVDVTAKQTTIEFGFLSRGFAYNGTLPVVYGLTLTNYNSRPVTVILYVDYKTNFGRKPYPRYFDQLDKTLTVVVPAGKTNNSKFVSLPASGNTYVTEIVSVDMIVRPLQ